MPFLVISFFAEVKILVFRPKTMDYNPWFDFFIPKKVLKKECLSIELEKRNLMALVSVA